MALFTFQPLESRLFLSSPDQIPSGEGSPSVALPAAQVSSTTAAAGITLRQELIAHFTDPLASSLRKTLRHSGVDAFDATLLKYMMRRDTARYYFRSKDLPTYIDFASRYGYMKDQLPDKVARGDAVLAHLFPEQQNSHDYTVQLSADIDWDAQPRATDNADFLHTLNRQSFWPELAISYRITGDVRYVDELISQLESWSDQNPPLANPDDWPTTSPHWWLLDSALRAENWIQSYFIVLGSPGWTAEANTLFLSGMWDHGDFLAGVTPGRLTANRTTQHATALLDIAILFPEFAAAPVWQEQGASLMFQALQAQFYPDGGHVEETPAYQGGVLNAFLDTYYLEQLNQLPAWRRGNRIRLMNAIEAYLQFITTSGALPGLSDTYRLSGNPLPFFTHAAVVLGDSRYRVTPPSFDDLFVIGIDGIPKAKNFIQYQLPNRGISYSLPDAGYYIARGGQSELYFDAGPKGDSHGHYDLFNFELRDSTLLVVADLGPFTYGDSRQRRWAISTPAHNTVSIDGLNHAAIEGANNPAIVVDQFDSSADSIRITAHHYAYEYLPGQPVVGRSVWVDRTIDNYGTPLAIVVDWGRSNSPHTFTSSFTLPGNMVAQVSPGIVDNTQTQFFKDRFQTLLGAGQTTELTSTLISNSPPPTEPDPAFRYTISQTGDFYVAVTLISEYVFRGPETRTPPSIAWVSGPPQPGQAANIVLTRSDGSTHLLSFAQPDLIPLPDPARTIQPPPDIPPSMPAVESPFSTTLIPDGT